MNSKLKTFIFIGRSGSGKGTQAKLLIDVLKKEDPDTPIFYQETGEVFRDFIKGDSYTQELSRDIMNKGGLQPPFLAVLMWGNAFVEKLTGKEHLFIDGTPRYLEEAILLDSALSFYERSAQVIYVDISKEEATNRLLQRGREDDKECKDIEERMRWFDESVQKTIEYYEKNKKHNFLHIKGEQEIETVHKKILEEVNLQ